MKYQQKIQYKLYSFLICLLVFMNTSYASPNNKHHDNSAVETKAYKIMANALYNDDIYMPLRLEIINKLVRLGQRSESSFKISDITFNNKLYKNISSKSEVGNMLSDKSQEYPLASKLRKKVLSKLEDSDHAQETLILSQLLNSPNDVLNTYTKKVFMQINQPESVQYIESVLKETSNKYPILVYLAKQGQLKPLIQELKKVNPDNYVAIEQILSSFVLAKKESLAQYKHELTPLFRLYQDSEIDNIAFYALVLLTTLDDEPTVSEILKITKTNSGLADLLTNSGVTLIAASNGDAAAKLLTQLYQEGNDSIKVSVLSNAYLIDNKSFDRLTYIREALASKNQNLAGGALFSAATIGDESLSPDIITCLKGLYLDNLFLSKYSKSNKGNLDVVSYILQNSSTKNKLVAAEILLTIGDESLKKEAVEVLQTLLQDSNTEIILLAANTLEQNGYTLQNVSLKNVLEKIGEDIYTSDYINTVILLAKSGDRTVVPRLKEIIDISNNRNIVTICSFLLLKLGDDSYKDIVKAYLANDLNEIIPDKYFSFDSFSSLLTDQNDMVKLNTAIILSALNPQGVISTLEDLTKSEDLKVRAKAASFLPYVDSYNNTALLFPLLNDLSVRVRVNAAESILRIVNRTQSIQQ